MSKAFVKDDAVEPDAAEALPPRPHAQPITPRGQRALAAELAALVEDGRGETRRARLLAHVLASVTPTPPALHNGGAGFGCAVDVEHEDGARRTYELVGPDEVDASAGRITPASPLGRALLGARAGDSVVVRKPAGEEELVVVGVRVSREP